MDSNFDFTIPETLRDIKLSQWQRYIEILEKNKDAELTGFLEKKLLGIFCGVELKDIDRIGLSVFDNTIQHLSNILNSKPELVKTFKMTGTDDVTVEFGLIPNFDKMSYGEFVDLEKYLFVDKDLHRAMAVMYRPVKLKSKGSYLIHDYNGTEYLAEVMKNTPLDVALSARVFFLSFSDKIIQLYDGLYTQRASAEAGRSQGQAFGKKWGNYQAIFTLAGEDVRRIGEVTELPVHQCLMYLEFIKEKSELEERMLKAQTR